MSVNCKAVIGPFNYDAACECTLVDFDLNVTGLCNRTRYAIVAVVKCNGRIVATVCRIFNVAVDADGDGDVDAADSCMCVSKKLEFRNVITDVECCDGDCEWTVEVPCANYILGCCR